MTEKRGKKSKEGYVKQDASGMEECQTELGDVPTDLLIAGEISPSEYVHAMELLTHGTMSHKATHCSH